MHWQKSVSLKGKAVCLLAALLLTSLLASCDGSKGSTSSQSSQPSDRLELVFTYGSEKEKWIKEVTEKFNQAKHRASNGNPIFVSAMPMGSGESIDEILTGKRKPHLTSPASAAFITLGNAQSRAKTGQDLVGQTENLVLSPVVIAMWKPMAEVLGWGKKPIGWADILALSRDPKGWAAHGFPQWGRFKFGHTHPEYSNSGLISLLAETYAATGKRAGLTLADVNRQKTAEYLGQIERSVVHYGSSTGFFGRKMFENGPQYLSAAVLYENMVIESYAQTNLAFPVVAVYPKEGTFWSDHPVGIVNREWVTPVHREAAAAYIKFLLDRPQQERAMFYGFRPGVPEINLAAPLDTQHGIDPKEPKTTLEVPTADVMDAIIKQWRENKKHANIVLVIDTSGSMKGERIVNARAGAKSFISQLGNKDIFSLMPFSSRSYWAIKVESMGQSRDKALAAVEGLFADGGTALYDSISSAYVSLRDQSSDNTIQAVVVLTDGEDTESRLKLENLIQQIQFDSEKRTTRIFTIGYGKEANEKALRAIADAAQGRFYRGSPENIDAVFKEISTFF
jgi:Ca-activated chloride channel family protein